jgi:hypothetical protein
VQVARSPTTERGPCPYSFLLGLYNELIDNAATCITSACDPRHRDEGSVRPAKSTLSGAVSVKILHKQARLRRRLRTLQRRATSKNASSRNLVRHFGCASDPTPSAILSAAI